MTIFWADNTGKSSRALTASAAVLAVFVVGVLASRQTNLPWPLGPRVVKLASASEPEAPASSASRHAAPNDLTVFGDLAGVTPSNRVSPVAGAVAADPDPTSEGSPPGAAAVLAAEAPSPVAASVAPPPVADPAAPTIAAPPSPVDAIRMRDMAAAMIKRGDIAGARVALSRLERLGDSLAAFQLAETYDPTVLDRLGVRGIRGDADRARALYQEASSGGVADAQSRIAALSAGAPAR